MGLPISVYSLYGPARKGLSREMLAVSRDVARLGAGAIPDMFRDILAWRRRRPEVAARLWRTIPWRRWSCLEVAGENLWAFFVGFRLATLMAADGVTHVHAGWANGPATAAMVAASLLDVPFSFSGRAGDIYPQDGALADKMRLACFAHTNNRANVDYLAGFAANGDARKIHLVYNSLTLSSREKAAVRMQPPYPPAGRGRFCRTKGFDVLLRACRILKATVFPSPSPWSGRASRPRAWNGSAAGSGWPPGSVPRIRVPRPDHGTLCRQRHLRHAQRDPQDRGPRRHPQRHHGGPFPLPARGGLGHKRHPRGGRRRPHRPARPPARPGGPGQGRQGACRGPGQGRGHGRGRPGTGPSHVRPREKHPGPVPAFPGFSRRRVRGHAAGPREGA